MGREMEGCIEVWIDRGTDVMRGEYVDEETKD